MKTYLKILDENMMEDGIRYEIGKRYKLPSEEIKLIKDVTDLFEYEFNFKLNKYENEITDRIFNVKINKKKNYFIIKNEVDYKKTINSLYDDNFCNNLDEYLYISENLFLITFIAIKFNKKKYINKIYSINDMINGRNSNMYVFDPNETMVYIKNRIKFGHRGFNFKIYEIEMDGKYHILKDYIYSEQLKFLKEVDYTEFINQLNKKARQFNENKLLIELLKLHNDELLNENITSKDELILSAIASIGRQQDLDKLINGNFPMVCEEVAKHGRYDDLNKLINKNNYRVFSGMFESNNHDFKKRVFNRRDSSLQDYIYEFNRKSLEDYFIKENDFGLFSQNEHVMKEIIGNSNNEKIIKIAKQSDEPLIKNLLEKYNR